MGLDASVACDCLERGLIRTPPPPGIAVEIGPDGFPTCDEGLPIEEALRYDRWAYTMCQHDGQILLHHRLGHLGLIIFLREHFGQHADRHPILLSRVLYSAFHAGDWLEVPQVRALGHELVCAKISLPSAGLPREDRALVATFIDQMCELRDAALWVQKPIAF